MGELEAAIEKLKSEGHTGEDIRSALRLIIEEDDNMTHLIADESIGGIQREFIEVERKASVGDYVTYVYEGNRDNVIRKVDEIDRDGDVHFDDEYVDNNGDRVSGFADGAYHVLEPTDIVHIEGTRYRLVERKAEVGDKVLDLEGVTAKLRYCLNADRWDDETGVSVDDTFYETEDFYDGDPLYHDEYHVLIPVAPSLSELLAQVTPENRNEEVFVEETQCSPQVLDMLANLARRVTELERENKRITEDLGWHEMGPGRIANLRNSISDLKHVLHTLETDVEQERDDSDEWAGVVNRRLDGFESQLRDTQGNVERQAQELATLEQVVKSVKERGITTAEQTESNTQDIADLDERTQPLVEPKQAAEHLLRKIAKLIEEEGVGI